ncbi:hypothetical protein D9M71_779880 [compost metagenome]
MAQLDVMPGKAILKCPQESSRGVLDQVSHPVIRHIVVPSTQDAQGAFMLSLFGRF